MSRATKELIDNIKIMQAMDGQYYVLLRAGNNQVIFTSELYEEKSTAHAVANGMACQLWDHWEYRVTDTKFTLNTIYPVKRIETDRIHPDPTAEGGKPL